MSMVNLDKVEHTTVRQQTHRFGNYDEDQPSLFGIKMPFSSQEDGGKVGVQFYVAFDVIEGNFPFLLGLPSLMAMGSTIYLKYRKSLSRLEENSAV